MNTMILRSALLATFLLMAGSLAAQTQLRVIVLPFRNMDGKIDYNLWQYELADSLRTVLHEMDPNEEHYHLVDPDSVEMAIAEFNLDPTNAQYESDIWRAVDLIKADKVVQGNFFLRGDRVLMNAYVYDVEYKMADPVNQAKDIYKTPDSYLSAVKKMAKQLYPGLAP